MKDMSEKHPTPRKRDNESKEILTTELAQWLGAVFNIEGSLYFSKDVQTRKGHPEPTARPIMKISIDDENAREVMRKILGIESPTPAQEKSKYVELLSQKAVNIATQIKMYAPSMALIIQYFQWWGEGENPREKYQVAVAYDDVSKDVLSPISEEEYVQLIQYPAFVAGIIDLRGNYYDHPYREPSKDGEKIYERRLKGIRIQCQDLNLLNALHRKFIGQKPYQEKNSYTWRVSGVDLLNLIRFAEPYLKIFKLPDST